MTRAFIVGPLLRTDTLGIVGLNAAPEPDSGTIDLIEAQRNALIEAGIADVTVIYRNLPGNMRPFALSEVEDVHSQALFVRYDAVLDPELLYFVTHAQTSSVILSAHRISRLDSTEPVQHRNGRLVGGGNRLVGRRDIEEEFYGVALLTQGPATALLRELWREPKAAVTDALDRLCNDHQIEVIRWTQAGGKHKHSPGGGSYARSNLVTRFRKEARDLGRRKLRDEIRYLTNLPAALKSFYPTVYASGETAELVYMEQEFLPMVTLGQYLFTGNAAPEQAVRLLERIIGAVHRTAYAPHLVSSPPDYLDQFHFLRAWHRLKHTLARAPVFSGLLSAQHIWINGERHWNVPQLLIQLERSEPARRLIAPELVSPWAHGDLHFENIMVDAQGDTFRLVDPRGYDYCDIYYDLGKISHSTNGKYDFVHESRFSLSWRAEKGEAESDFTVTPSTILSLYEAIDARMRGLYRDITGDPLAEGRVLFAEAMHFCTMMPFHLKDDGKEDRAVAIYLTGVRLLNEVFNVLGLEVDPNVSPVGPEFWDEREWRNVG